jgi:hypothetical protein
MQGCALNSFGSVLFIVISSFLTGIKLSAPKKANYATSGLTTFASQEIMSTELDETKFVGGR